MTDASDPQHGDRPRPRYGEYASPEEQRRRMQANPRPAPPPQVEPTPVAPSGAVPVAGEAARPGRMVDRVVTLALLIYGLLNTITSTPQMTDYASYAETMFRMMGVDATLSDPGAARGWGLAAALVMGIGWLLTAVFAWTRLRAGKLAFWVPLVGAVVFLGISGALLAIPLLNDPAVLDALLNATPGL